MSTTRQQLKAAEKVAKAFPLFADQLVPELPKLQAHVAANGSKDMIQELPKYDIGQRVKVAKVSYTLEYATGTICHRSPCWSYEGKWKEWNYYVKYDEGQNVPNFTQALPVWPTERIVLISSSSQQGF